jgi:mRNA-degrading endonuclease YafQ of YafQ-DinJ toxin-antitoxin module
MVIRASSAFRKAYKKMPVQVKRRALEKERIFRANPFDSRLGTHKLHGKYQNYWAFTVTGQYRIMFAFLGSDTADFITIGTHGIYR